MLLQDDGVILSGRSKLEEQKQEGDDDDNRDDHDDDRVDTRSAPIDVNLSLPLKFQQKIIQDLIQNDGLLVLGKGLGLETITANLLHVLGAPTTLINTKRNNKNSKRSLVILLNAYESENEKISQELLELSWLDSFEDLNLNESNSTKNPFVVVGGENVTVDKRGKIYQKGGIISVRSRVFVVDLLSGIIDPNLITGIVLLHAERISETSNESFILTLYRENNGWGFIKALSDQPESFNIGFQPLYNKLKDLKLNKVFLWPRFHIDVTSSLLPKTQNNKVSKKDTRNIVIEINVKMTESMKQIQIAILACIDACISEIRRHNPTLSTEYWTSENALDDEFVRVIRGSLDPVWHRVSWTTKQLVYDLTTLKDLLFKLLSLDSIKFYEFIFQIVESNKPSVNVSKLNQSPWLMLDEATTIITYAKQRVFQVIKEKQKETDKIESTYLLEEQPKWEQLALLLDDINQERQLIDNLELGPVLIMCSSNTVCRQLRTYLTKMKENISDDGHGNKSYSGRKMMIQRIKEYLDWKRAVSKINKSVHQQTIINQQRQQNKKEEELITSKTFTRGKAPPGKRRRTRGNAAVASVNRLHRADLAKENEDIDLVLLDRLDGEIIEVDFDKSQHETEDYDDIVVTGSKVTTWDYDYIDRKDQIIIEAFNNNTDDILLQEIMPSYIIMYEPDLSFIRRVEVYQAVNKDRPAKTFFMYYGNSVEEQKHLNNIRKEKESFTKLIREKGKLANTFSAEEDNKKFQNIRKDQVYNTRIAGGSTFKDPNKETRVIVDMREFSGSSLPNLLHRIGIRVFPCMLTVGDYIISPKICIERKSIPDLISSFKSGRLYQQCEQMFRHYELPTLLIEFEENKSFSLDPFSELRTRLTNNFSGKGTSDPITSKLLQQDIQSKLIMLLLAFPKLKIIWSSSPYQTAQIILELKAKQDEPDPSIAVSVGLDDHDDAVDGPPQYNDAAIDLIQNIPGINNVNYHLIIRKIRNIRELVNMPEEELGEIIGKEAARKATNFFVKNCLKD
ncbi:hypothetical protein PACTADRAFT_44994 [Pachysolen tannophilus NRRL Y-2460]|uniref:ERCC4 domain-containing protein n=1 Tax=Pachysolen tannophilus NRRL Y-2460 TaxID=669874 RepID=A0A1E4TR62_PACTA|nr:hypothetical protein PACTADRAFT_44994 [Pachysolen tannophilus NRRL Y-2460]